MRVAELKRWLAESEAYEEAHGVGSLLNEAHPARARLRALIAEVEIMIAAQMEVAAEIRRASAEGGAVPPDPA